MNAPTMKALPLRIVWFGPPFRKGMVTIEHYLKEEGILIERHVDPADGMKIPADVDCCVVMEGMAPSAVVRRARDIAKAHGKVLVYATSNARITKQRIAAAGIKPKLVPIAPPPIHAHLNRAEPLKVTVAEIASSKQLSADTRPSAPTTPAPMPPNIGWKISDLGINRKIAMLDVIAAGPAKVDDIVAAFISGGLTDELHGRSVVGGTATWLRSNGFVTFDTRREPKFQGGALSTYTWTKKPYSREIIEATNKENIAKGAARKKRAANARRAAKARLDAEKAKPSDLSFLDGRTNHPDLPFTPHEFRATVVSTTIEACDLGYGAPDGRKRRA